MPESPRPRTARQAAEQVAATLREAGHQALFAGGCVRDLLLGREPDDYDVATDAVPGKVRKLFRRTLHVGAQFGVVIVLLGDMKVEVATFRSETGYADGRHPDHVTFSNAEADARRRDFTINGMFMDPAGGEVVDYVGGRGDLDRRLVRAIGNPAERFAEDQLRMLRAVRFAAVLEFELDEDTAAAIRGLSGRLSNVSAERIWQEWRRVLGNPHRARGWRLAVETGLAAAQWPRLMESADAIGRRLERLAPDADAVAALACQFLDQPRADVQRLARDLTLDNASRESTAWLVAHRDDLLAGPLDLVNLKKRMAHDDWHRLVWLSRATAEGGQEESLRRNLAAADAVPPDAVDPDPLIDGADVIALGVPEGPKVGQVLDRVRDEQLAARLKTRDQALDLARELLRELGGGAMNT